MTGNAMCLRCHQMTRHLMDCCVVHREWVCEQCWNDTVGEEHGSAFKFPTPPLSLATAKGDDA